MHIESERLPYIEPDRTKWVRRLRDVERLISEHSGAIELLRKEQAELRAKLVSQGVKSNPTVGSARP